MPSTENVNTILNDATKRYTVIFTLLIELGAEGHELEKVTQSDIDAEQGIINVQGCKGHNSRSLKLKQQTAEMLRAYLYKYAGEHPFPKSIRITVPKDVARALDLKEGGTRTFIYRSIPATYNRFHAFTSSEKGESGEKNEYERARYS